MLVDGQEVDVGMIISFRTLNEQDPNVRQGTVVGITSFDIAKSYSDVTRYHQEVMENGAYSDEEDVTALDFLLIRTDDPSIEVVNGESTEVQGTRINAFAVQWVEPTTLSIIDAINILTFKVYGVQNSEAETIVQLLRDNNYKATYILPS